MALDVGLVDDVQTELVAEVVEPGGGRGMGGADGVDVEPLGQAQLEPGGLRVDVATPGRAVLVPVDPPDQRGSAVDPQLAATNLDRAEPGEHRRHLDRFDSAVGRARIGRGLPQLHQHPVARRALVTPCLDAGHLQRGAHHLAWPGVRGEQSGQGVGLVEGRHLHRLGLEERRAVELLDRNTHPPPGGRQDPGDLRITRAGTSGLGGTVGAIG